MADNFNYVGTLGGVSPEQRNFKVASGTTASILRGQLVTCNAGFCALVADGGCATIGRYGLATSTSTETTLADGNVDVQFCPSGLLVQGAATTPVNLVQAVIFTRVTLDVAAGVQTVDENDPTGVLTILPADNDTNFPNDSQVVVALPWTVDG